MGNNQKSKNKLGLLLLLATVFAFSFVVADCPAGMTGDGSIGNSCMITNCTDLQSINENLTANYELANDIDCTDTVNWNGGLGFTPIFNFDATLNGSFYVIDGLFSNRTGVSDIGLFASPTANSLITSVGLENVYMLGRFYVAGLVGDGVFATVDKSYVTGTIIGEENVGGIIGRTRGLIENSYAIVNVTATGRYAGGIVGGLETNGVVNNSYSNSNVISPIDAGGLVGHSTESTTIDSSYSLGSVYTSLNDGGGLIGKVDYGNVDNSYTGASVSGTGIGGFIGYQYYANVDNSYWNNFAGNPSIATQFGGLVGLSEINNDETYFYNIANEPMASWDFTNVWSNSNDGTANPILLWQPAPEVIPVADCPAGMTGDGSLVSPCMITNCTDLDSVRDNVTANYELANDIDCSDTATWNGGLGFTPIALFDATLNGSFYAIDSLTINKGSGDTAGSGLFNLPTANIVVTSLGLENINITGGNHVGGIVGVTGGVGSYVSIDKCYVTGTLTGGVGMGGLVGTANNISMTSSYSDADITGTGNYIGGLVGRVINGYINNSYSTSNVSGTSSVGGLAGILEYPSILSNSYSDGNIYASSSQGGGVVGYAAYSNIDNSYTGSGVTGSGVGGFIGFSYDATIDNCYWNNFDGNPSTASSSGGLSGVSEVSDDETYLYNIANEPMASWDFTNVWSNSNDGTANPILLWQPAPEVIPEENETTTTTTANEGVNLYGIMASSGAGLGIFIEIMAVALPVLLLGLMIVGVVLAVGFAVAGILTRFNLIPQK